MAIDYRHGISIFELIVYFPCMFASLVVVFRHGFRKTSGWIFLFLFSTLRIVGAICSLASISKQSTGLMTAVVVCSSVGVSPLMMACLGLLSRANDSLRRETDHGLNPLVLHFVHIVTMIPAILSAIGSSNSQGQGGMSSLTHPSTKTKIGTVLYLVAWIILTLIFFYFASKKKYVPSGEGRLVITVGISLPLILVRLIYTLISRFANDSRFSLVQGDVTINLVMVVLEEMAVTIICLAVGVTLQKAVPYYNPEDSENQTPMRTQYKPVDGIEQSPPPPGSFSYQSRRNRRRGGAGGLIGGGGLIGHAVMAGVDAIQSRQERGRR